MQAKEEQLRSINIYLIRAVREWAMDNGLTPQLLVDAYVEGVDVPVQHVKDGKITLNVHDQAVRTLEFSDEWITFSARFSGASYTINLPTQSILAIFSRETNQGIYFQQAAADRNSENADLVKDARSTTEMENHKSATHDQHGTLVRRHLRLVE
ncbi:MAG: ClpXP protease specificity-enhancing factor [Acidiferrobacteraceae bacterium]|nr:ClpXP protease specificity-enhancing factor [Acidiferrobacteraceae bacterium]|tara:strand:+ start:1159 stop:1620 length:462 start_codon:yes stop_codon:yes gene_type:complete